MREIGKIAETLFDKIRSRFENVSLGDENAQATTDPVEARFFNFEYISKDGTNFGNVTLSIIDNDSLKIIYGKNITDELDQEQQDEWFQFLRGLREFARRNMLTFDTRDITRSNLDINSIKQQSKANSTYSSGEVEVTESVEQVINESMYGSRINSYEDRGPVTIRVKHSDFIDPEKRGARARKIESIYLETHRGERFLLDHNNLDYARAQARHISEGGVMHDERGQHISELMKEMASMRHFVAGARRRQFEDRETQDMVHSALKHYDQDKRMLRQMRGARGYRAYFEAWIPEAPVEETVDVDRLRERFVKKIYDDRFNEALPYVYRAYRKEQSAMETAMAEEFATWANQVHEDTWDTADTNAENYDLDEIMKTPLEVGQDGLNAIATMSDIIGSEDLEYEFKELASEQGPEADARIKILSWLDANNPELAAKYHTALQPPATPEQPPVPNQTVAAATPVPQMQPTESIELEQMLRIAGLRK
jgi:hypothetical protein